jgi:hypothetical protein
MPKQAMQVPTNTRWVNQVLRKAGFPEMTKVRAEGTGSWHWSEGFYTHWWGSPCSGIAVKTWCMCHPNEPRVRECQPGDPKRCSRYDSLCKLVDDYHKAIEAAGGVVLVKDYRSNPLGTPPRPDSEYFFVVVQQPQSKRKQ